MARPYIGQSSPAAEVHGRGAFLCTSFLSASGSQQTSRPQIGQQLVELSDHIQLSGGIGHSRSRRNFPGRASRALWTCRASRASGSRRASHAIGAGGSSRASYAIGTGGSSRAGHAIGTSGTRRTSHAIGTGGSSRASYAIGTGGARRASHAVGAGGTSRAGGCNHICATPTKSVLSFPLSNTIWFTWTNSRMRLCWSAKLKMISTCPSPWI